MSGVTGNGNGWFAHALTARERTKMIHVTKPGYELIHMVLLECASRREDLPREYRVSAFKKVYHYESKFAIQRKVKEDLLRRRKQNG